MCWRKYTTPHYSSHSLAPKEARISVMYSVHRTTEEIYLSMAKEQNGSHIVEVIVINGIFDQPFKGSFFFFFCKLPKAWRIIKHYDTMLFGISRMSIWSMKYHNLPFWKLFLRILLGGNQCLLFCYPDGEELFYYFGKARDGTQCSKEPYGVCVRGRCKVRMKLLYSHLMQIKNSGILF